MKIFNILKNNNDFIYLEAETSKEARLLKRLLPRVLKGQFIFHTVVYGKYDGGSTPHAYKIEKQKMVFSKPPKITKQK